MNEEPAPRNRWQELTGGTSGADYHARLLEFAASGAHVHGEADLCAALLDAADRPRAGLRVLDAGCGTGRVGIRLAELGFEVVGVDVDESMLAVARVQGPTVPWFAGDLADLPPDVVASAPFDLVVLAGNVVPLLAPGTLRDVVRALASLLRPGGMLVAGFGLDAAHLPAGCPVTPLEAYDAAATAEGLEPVDRFATWEAAPYDPAAGYAVSIHRHP